MVMRFSEDIYASGRESSWEWKFHNSYVGVRRNTSVFNHSRNVLLQYMQYIGQ